MSDLERIAHAIENLEAAGSTQVEFGVETHMLISWGITEISEKLERIAIALEEREGG